MEPIRFKHFKRALTCQPFFIWHNLETSTNYEELVDNFWSIDIEEAPQNIQQVMVQTFGLLDKTIEENIRSSYDTITLIGSLEDRLENTKKYFDSNKTVIGAVFEYNGAYSTPLAFNFENNTIFEKLFSGKTKRKDFLKAFYQWEIISKNVNVENYLIFLPKDVEDLRGKINIQVVDKINPTKTGSYPDEVNSKGELKSISISNAIKNNIISKNESFPNFESTIELIKNSLNTDLSNNLVNDTTYWGDNPQWKELLNRINHPLANFTGHIQKKKAIANGKNISSPTYDKIMKINESKILDEKYVKKVLDLFSNNKNIVWYDFEGFSLPYPAVDFTKPHRQQVFQVSVILTSNLNEIFTINEVFDPQTLNYKNFYKIIKTVYQDKKDKYVVYNKGYEISRMREMLNVINRFDKDMFLDAEKMLDHIEENTIDLFELFKWSGSKLPSILLNDQGGFASIKNIEKHISKNNIKVKPKIKEYKDLKIQNGYMAMETAIKRSTNVIGDKEWTKLIPSLKEYCENDVRMMIVVYDFICQLYDKQKSNV